MKPKFLEVIRFAVLLIAIAVVVGTVFTSYDGCKATVDSIGHSVQHGAGVAGPLGWIWGWVTWFTYLFFIGCVTLVVVLVLWAFNVFALLVKAFVGTVATARQAWAPIPLTVDTVLEVTSSGREITLGQVLKNLQRDLQSQKELTSGLKPPPPPKTAAEVAAEKDAQLAEMARALAAVQAELNRKTIVVAPAAVPVNTPAEGGAA